MIRERWTGWASAAMVLALAFLSVAAPRGGVGAAASLLGLLGMALLLGWMEAVRRQGEATRRGLMADARTARAEAAAARGAREDALATIAHELRGPLNALVGWVRALRSGKLDEAGSVRALNALERSAMAQAGLVAELLDASRLVADKVPLEAQPIELATIVSDAVASVQPEAEAKGVYVECEAAPPARAVYGNPAHLHQVMANLLSNALKFTPRDGLIAVRVAYDDAHAMVTVEDSGKGIQTDFLPHVFDRYCQANGTDAHLGGLGLGLTIVRRLVALHGGTVGAASDGEGRGARFTVTLPLTLAREEDDPPSAPGAGTNGASRGRHDETLRMIEPGSEARQREPHRRTNGGPLPA